MTDDKPPTKTKVNAAAAKLRAARRQVARCSAILDPSGTLFEPSEAEVIAARDALTEQAGAFETYTMERETYMALAVKWNAAHPPELHISSGVKNA